MTTKPRRRMTVTRFKKEYLSRWQLYLLLVLPIAYLLIFSYYPMFGVQIAFKKFRYDGGIWGSPWVGLYQFERFLTAPKFFTVLKNTLTLSIYSLVASFPMPIIFALCLNVLRNARFKRFIQTVTYIPHFISIVVLCGMILQFFNVRIGIFGIIYQYLHGGQQAKDWLGNANLFPHIYVWSGVWQNLGYSSIIYLSALSAVDPELHEAAMVDGASRLRRIFAIDLPTILPTATIMLILRMGQIMTVGFEKVYLLQNDLNLSKSEIISTYVYKSALGTSAGDFSYSTAIGLFNSLVNFILIVSVNAITRRLSETSLW